MKFFIRFLFFLLLHPIAYASCDASQDDCAPVSEWQFSLGLGVGAISNPLHDGKNIPLVIIPRISYYGERVFFENNTLGYSLYETQAITVSTITQLNSHSSFFKRWHPNNIFVDTFAFNFAEQAPVQDDQIEDKLLSERDVRIRPEDVRHRRIAIDAGLQLNWFLSASNQLQVKWLHDVNDVYQGSNMQAAYLTKYMPAWLPDTLFHFTLGLNWLSAAHVNYYYGISDVDNVPSYSYYQAKSSVNPYVKFSARYRINSDWQLGLSYKKEWLDKHIYRSPLVAEQVVETLFLGAVYAF